MGTNTPSESALADLKQSFATFIAWTVMLLAGTIAIFVWVDVDTTLLESNLGMWLVTMGILITALCCTIVFEDIGVERLGANSTASDQFVWPLLFYVQLALIPLRAALEAVVPATSDTLFLFILGTVVVAGWLAFFRGLEALGIESRHVGHVAVAGIGLIAIAYAFTLVVPATWTDDPTVRASALVAIQLGAIWLGLSGVVDRLLES